ncbi:MAG: PilZ domain-containing protein [Gammaproteobacteria bacterium]
MDPISLDNRRGAYRVAAETVDDLDLELLARRQWVRPGRLTDAAAGGACLQIDQAAVTDGDELEVRFRSAASGFSGAAQARVVRTSPAVDTQVVHLAFLGDTLRLQGRTPRAYELFNRRSAYRETGQAAAASLAALASPRAAGAASFQGYPVGIRNVSNTGVCLDVDAATHTALEAHAGLDLRFELPGRVAPVVVACAVHYRMAERDGYRYGCEFDWAATTDSLAVVEDLVTYILEADEDPA